MVPNSTALLIGAMIGVLVAGFVNAWEDQMVTRKNNWIVSVSIIGASAVVCMAAFVLGAVATRNNISDILLQVIFAAFLTFVPFRRVKILKNIFWGWGTRRKANDENKDD